MSKQGFSRRMLLRSAAAMLGLGVLGACAPKVIVETVVVEKEVEKLVKETIVVEKEVEKQVVVEKAAPGKKDIRVLIAAWVRAITPTDRQVAEYNQSHPDLNIIMEDSVAGWDTKVLASLRAGDTTWSAQLGDQIQLAKHVETELVVPVEDYLESSNEPGAEGILDDFHPLPMADCTYKGNLYGLSWRVDCDAFSYNKEMTSAVGMEEWPTTWQGIEELAAKIVKEFEDEGVWGILKPRHILHGATAIFYTLVDDPWTDEGFVDITHPKYIEALEMLKKWQDMKISPTPPWRDQGGAHMTLYEAGKAGMICTPHIWGKWAAMVRGTEVISYPVPMPPTGGKTPAWATPSFLLRNAPHPKETMDFIIYLFGPKNEAMIRSCIGGLGLPCWKSSFDTILSTVPGMGWQKDLMEFIGDATPMAKTTTIGIQNDKIMAKIEEYLTGRIPSAASAMEEALADVREEAAKHTVG